MSPGTWDQGHKLPRGHRHSLSGSTSPHTGAGDGDSQAALLGDSFGEMGELLRRQVGEGHASPFLAGDMLQHTAPGVPEATWALQSSGERLARPRVLISPLPPVPPALQSWAEMAPHPVGRSPPSSSLWREARRTHVAWGPSEAWTLLQSAGVCVSAQSRNGGPVEHACVRECAHPERRSGSDWCFLPWRSPAR